MRRFFLQDPDFEIPSTDGLVFRWSALDDELAYQIAYQEQFLRFQQHLLTNLQSVPSENPDWAATSLSLSLRAGAIKTCTLLAVSIAEGALLGLAIQRELGTWEQLHHKTYGQLLQFWDTEERRETLGAHWNGLRLLNQYRNYVHLANAANDNRAYWRDVLNHENELVAAVEGTLNGLSDLCNGN